MVKNRRVILLCGFERGGTNILWNILQSHPNICSPGYETGELFRHSAELRDCRFRRNELTVQELRRRIDAELFAYKMRALDHIDDRFKAENVPYRPDEVANAALCLKSVNDDIFLTKLLLDVYPELTIVALTRNGYALCEGYLRRGKSATEVGRTYSRIASAMQRLSLEHGRFQLVKFEDALRRPFEVAEILFSFTEMNPVQLDRLRLKSKKVIDIHGRRTVRHGLEERKYWFDREQIEFALASDVEEVQAGRLEPKSIIEFNKNATDALRYFGYAVRD